MRSEQIVFTPPSTGQGRDRSTEVVLRTTHIIDEIRFDGDYPKATFWPVIAPEAKVLNTIDHTFTRPKPEKANSQVVNPPRAEPPRDWSANFSWGGLVLGVVLVAVGLIARKRA